MCSVDSPYVLTQICLLMQGKWTVPLPKVKAVGEDEVFKVLRTGKRRKKAWKRMVTKVTYVGEGFTRKPPKYERFIRPMGLRFKKAHVTHPELKALAQDCEFLWDNQHDISFQMLKDALC